MPFKTIEQKRDWTREHMRKNPEKYKEWNNQSRERSRQRSMMKPGYVEAQRKKEEARTARMDAASLSRDLKLLDRAIAYIRRQAIKRERPHVCGMCGAVVQDADWSAKAGHKSCRRLKDQTHPKKLEWRKREYTRVMSTPAKKMIKNIRRRHNIALRHAIDGGRKNGTTIEYLGCTATQYVDYMKARLLDGMTLENYGVWHIDHIVPLASFNLNNEDEIRKAFHYSNTQPLWAADNIRKGCRLAPPPVK
jgi:hypothetical protein